MKNKSVTLPLTVTLILLQVFTRWGQQIVHTATTQTHVMQLFLCVYWLRLNCNGLLTIQHLIVELGIVLLCCMCFCTAHFVVSCTPHRRWWLIQVLAIKSEWGQPEEQATSNIKTKRQNKKRQRTSFTRPWHSVTRTQRTHAQTHTPREMATSMPTDLRSNPTRGLPPILLIKLAIVLTIDSAIVLHGKQPTDATQNAFCCCSWSSHSFLQAPITDSLVLSACMST